MKSFTLPLLSAAVLLRTAAAAAASDDPTPPGFLRQLANNKNEGQLFTMADCPGRCLAYNEVSSVIGLEDCSHADLRKYWKVDSSCGGEGSFFKIKYVPDDSLCIADPEDCKDCDPRDAECNTNIPLVNCDSDTAAWFSYGNLHKTSPKAYYLYSARCWLDKGLVFALATPSLEAKTCPEDHSIGACERLEWNLDRFSKDVLYYEWSFNKVSDSCDASLFP